MRVSSLWRDAVMVSLTTEDAVRVLSMLRDAVMVSLDCNGPEKKNVSSFMGGSPTHAKPHENCDFQMFFYKISVTTYFSMYLCIYIYIICLSVYLSVCLSVCLSVSIRVCLSIYLSIYKVREKLRVWFFPIPQVTWNRNKHRTWLDFMLISFPSIWSWFRRLCIAILFELLLLLFKIDFTQGFRFHFWCEDEAVLVEVNLVQGFTQNPDLMCVLKVMVGRIYR